MSHTRGDENTHIRLWRQLVLGTTLLAAASLAFAGSHCVRRFAGSGSYEEGTRQCSRRHSSGCTHIGMVLRHWPVLRHLPLEWLYTSVFSDHF
jgi:hypothetical protein